MNVFVNGFIYCMDENKTKAAALAWEGNKIIDIGSSEDISGKYSEAEITDLGGKSVFPGFIDPHHHLFIGTLYSAAINIDPDKKILKSEILERLKARASELDDGEWVVAYGYTPIKTLKGKALSREDLDDIVPNHPVVVINYGFHECVVNSRALEIAGIDDNTESPVGGEIMRRKDGKATGKLIETAWGMVERHACESLIKHNRNKLEQDLLQAQNERFASGITRIGDPQVTSIIEDFYRYMEKSGTLTMPVHMFPISDNNVFAPAWDKLGHVPTGQGPDSDILKIGPLKVLFDGATSSSIASCMTKWQAIVSIFTMLKLVIKTNPFDAVRAAGQNPVRMTKGNDNKLHFGLKCYRPGEDAKIISEAVEKGFSIAIHAIGNEAVDDAINAISHSRKQHSDTPPPRIEHGLSLGESLIGRMREQNIMLVTQPPFLRLGEMNIPGLKMMPLRTLLDSGVRVAGSSDWPAAPYEPLEGIRCAVTRGKPVKGKKQQKEAITIQEAFELYTREAAYALGCLDETGSLEKGKRADMVVLSEDPYAAGPERLSEISVFETVVGGTTVFKKME